MMEGSCCRSCCSGSTAIQGIGGSSASVSKYPWGSGFLEHSLTFLAALPLILGQTCLNWATMRTTRNPHSTERYTGGSSSGPAAVVACGLCPAALGSDGGGSIRIPSSLCGVVGLKTTYARSDRTGCFVEGEWLRNAFRWREIIGPWEERHGHFGDV